MGPVPDKTRAIAHSGKRSIGPGVMFLALAEGLGRGILVAHYTAGSNMLLKYEVVQVLMVERGMVNSLLDDCEFQKGSAASKGGCHGYHVLPTISPVHHHQQ